MTLQIDILTSTTSRFACATLPIGTPSVLPSRVEGNSYTAPVRGLFRCDTFVLWALSAPAYQTVTSERSRWKNYIHDFAYKDPKTPSLVFDGLKSYR